MKYRMIAAMSIAMAVVFAAITSQAQNLQGLLPPKIAHQANATAGGNHASTLTLDATVLCNHTFTVPGKLNGFLQFCVTVNGNITSFESPAGFDYIRQNAQLEGYGICDLSNGVEYWDYAVADSSNWDDPVELSITASAVKIARPTLDGAFTLTQTISKQPGPSPYAKVTMSIKNNSGITKTVYLHRFADVDPQNAATTGDFNQSFDSSQYSAWGYTPLNYSGPNAAGLGMLIEELGQPNVPYGFEGLSANRFDGVPPCSPTLTYAGYQAAVDGGIEMLWVLQIGPGKTGTVNAKYAQF